MEVEHFTDWGLEIKQDAYDEGFAEGRAEGEAKGLAEGEAKGLAAGRVEGEAKGLARAVASIAEKLDCSLDEAFDMVSIPDNLKDEVLKLVNELSDR